MLPIGALNIVFLMSGALFSWISSGPSAPFWSLPKSRLLREPIHVTYFNLQPFLSPSAFPYPPFFCFLLQHICILLHPHTWKQYLANVGSQLYWKSEWINCSSNCLFLIGEAWRAAIHGVAKSRTWLSDWTELNTLINGKKFHSEKSITDLWN